jgi:hypothetical protein
MWKQVCQRGKSCQIWQYVIFSCVLNMLQGIKAQLIAISGTCFPSPHSSHTRLHFHKSNIYNALIEIYMCWHVRCYKILIKTRS